MQRPPSKPKAPDDLAEVERALSVLQGRNPEFERARREDEEARARRRAAIEASARDAASKARRRILLIAVVASAIVALLVWVGSGFRSELARRARIERASDIYRSMGFVVVETSSRGAPGKLEDNPERGCLLAVTTGTAPLTVRRASGAEIHGPAPIVFCTCAAEKLSVTSAVDETGGLALLRIDAAAVGGSKAFAYLPFDAGTTANTDEPCSDATLDAWIEGKRHAAPPADDRWLAADARRRTALEAVGAKTLAVVEKPRPFAAVALPKDACVLATSSQPDDRLTLRSKGGATPIAAAVGAFVWCAATEAVVTVHREGEGDVSVLAVPAARVGGSVGFEELLAEAGVRVGRVATPPTDHAWNAKQLLVASAVPEVLVTTASAPEIPPAPDARIVALSFGIPNALVADPAAEVYSFCTPPLGDTTTDAVCAFTGAHAWKPSSPEAIGGVARAKLPYWLFAFEGATEPSAAKAVVDLIVLARKLWRDGFEATTLEAVTELPNGAEVLGRVGEDAVVAFGLAPVEPWIFPYSDGTSWSVDGTPRVVEVKPLEKVKLVAISPKLPPKETRRSVVFRRQVAPQKN